MASDTNQVEHGVEQTSRTRAWQAVQGAMRGKPISPAPLFRTRYHKHADAC